MRLVLSFCVRAGFHRLLKNPEQQIPHRLKPVRDDKKKELERGAEAPHYPSDGLNRVFRQPVKPVRGDTNRGQVTAQLKLRPFNLAKSESRIANGEKRRAQSGHLRLGGSHAG